MTAMRTAMPKVTCGRITEWGPSATEESIIFQVDEDFTVPAAQPAAYVVQRGGQVKSIGVADGTAKPAGNDQLAFASPPAVGDAVYLYQVAVGSYVEGTYIDLAWPVSLVLVALAAWQRPGRVPRVATTVWRVACRMAPSVRAYRHGGHARARHMRSAR